MAKQEEYRYMRMAIREARKGQGRTSPNPCVGAVIVRDGQVVGKGYHRKAGEAHAEINALAAAGREAHGAVMYVTLEPCNHQGKTPPCTQAVLKAGIRRVVVGMKDPNPGVVGGGCEYLAAHGVEVESGLLEGACRALNYPFIKFSRTRMPWVVMKAGMSLDARITYQPGQSGWITGEEARLHSHGLRDRFDAIMIGVETALIDDPSLTTRLPNGQGRDPLRVVLDSTLRLSPEARMLSQQSTADTLIFCGPEAPSSQKRKLEEAGAVVVRMENESQGRLDLQEVLATLAKREILSVLVEGGATLHGSLLRQNLVDQLFFYVAPFIIGDGGTPLVRGYEINSADEALRLARQRVTRLGDDLLIEGLISDI